MSMSKGDFSFLDVLPVGKPARIIRIRGGRQLSRRLMGLGLRVGSQIKVVQHRAHGVVVANGANRVALGGGVVDKLEMEPLD